MFGNDLLSCAVTAKAVIDGDIEELEIPVNPLDVLAQVLLSMCCTEEWNIDELYLFITSVYHWKSLARKHFDLVLEMLNGRYSDTRIGELDEEFVWERNHGDFFTLGTQTWRIDNINDRSVEVSPADTGGAMSPFWKADPNGRDFFYSGKILFLLETIESELAKPRGSGEAAIKSNLIENFSMEEDAAEALISFLKRQRDFVDGSLPHRNHLLIEHFNDPLNRTDCHQIILHTLWGGKMNFPYSEAISQAWENKEGYPLQVFCDDDAIILDLPHQFSVDDVLTLVNGDNLEKLLRQRLESTMFFGGRFRHNSSRALLLPRKSFKQRTPLWLTRLRSKKLLQAVCRYEDFPILTETWRSCLHDDFDLDSLRDVLDEIREGQIKVREVVTKSPSPFAAGLIYDHTNQRMYEDDTPLGGPSNLREDLIKGIVHESGLRPMLPEKLVEEFNQKLQRTYPGYCPRGADDLLDWIEERIFIPLSQWEEMKSALNRNLDEDVDKIISEVEKNIHFWNSDSAGEELIISKTYHKKFGENGFREQMDFILPQWISFFGPCSLEYLVNIYPAPENEILKVIESLRESEEVIIDKLTEIATEDQFCTAENLEILFRLKRRKGRREFKALPITKLQLYLAQHQLITKAGTGKEDLQQVFEKMIAYGAKASLWETDFFPARIHPYYKSWLDTLFQESPLLWYGCGKEKIAFCFEDEQTLFIKKSEPDEVINQLLPDNRGSFSFWDIKEHSGKSSSELVDFLWNKSWSGQISNDHFSTVRTGIINKYSADSFKEMEQKSGGRKIRRGGYNRWMFSRPLDGRWFLTESIPPDEDLLEQDERMREVIRQLFVRYGILFRQLLERERQIS
jgi:ATP-dependent Lhr-like helicase